MKRLLSAASFAAALVLIAACAPRETSTAAAAATAAAIPYGANKDTGATFVHDGVTLYYETYGQGEPLLLVHGNGASIGTFAAQIEHFKATHKVIAMDSRDQGRSADSQEPITYEKMTDDLAALIEHLKRAGALSWFEIDTNPITRDSIGQDPWPVTLKPENIVFLVAGGSHPTHAYWLQGTGPHVHGRPIRVPETFDRLLAEADRDLGCGSEECRI